MRTVKVSQTRRFAHVMIFDPEYAERRAALAQGLTRVAPHPLGRLILDDLGIGGFAPFAYTELIRGLLAR